MFITRDATVLFSAVVALHGSVAAAAAVYGPGQGQNYGGYGPQTTWTATPTGPWPWGIYTSVPEYYSSHLSEWSSLTSAWPTDWTAHTKTLPWTTITATPTPGGPYPGGPGGPGGPAGPGGPGGVGEPGGPGYVGWSTWSSCWTGWSTWTSGRPYPTDFPGYGGPGWNPNGWTTWSGTTSWPWTSSCTLTSTSATFTIQSQITADTGIPAQVTTPPVAGSGPTAGLAATPTPTNSGPVVVTTSGAARRLSAEQLIRDCLKALLVGCAGLVWLF